MSTVEVDPKRIPRPRACAFCRSSKHKCDGIEGQLSCSRCARNQRECVWPARQRMGRPKRSQVEQQNAAPSSQSRLPSTSTNSPSNQGGSPASSSHPGTSAVTPDSCGPPETSNASDPWYPIKPTAENWDHSYKYPSRDSSVSSYAHWFGTVPSSSPSQKASEHSESPESASPPHTSLSAPSNNSSSADISGSILKELLKLIDIYYAIPHCFVPVLPPKSTLTSNLSSQSPLLLNAICAIAMRYAVFEISKNYVEIATSMINAAPNPTETTVEAIQHVQALLIMTYIGFGEANVSQAYEFCNRACNIALSLNWNIMDGGGDIKAPNVHTAPPSLYALLGGDASPYGSPSPVTDEAKDFMRMARQIWWECWVTDIMLSITCRSARMMQNVPLKVQIPSPPMIYGEPGCPIVWYHPLRIRALTLLLEAIGFPECPDSVSRSLHVEQFTTIDTLIENVMMECQLAWSDCVRVCSALGGASATATPLGSEAVIGKEIFHMTILMLHASSVHLHHLYAMPEVNFDVGVCGITTGAFVGDIHQSNEEYREMVFAPARSKIVSASRSLMSLLRSSHRTNLIQTAQESSYPTTRSNPELSQYADIALVSCSPSRNNPSLSSNASSVMVQEDILRHSPFCGCSQVVAAFGAALEVATAGTKWQALAAESNFETSKMVLQRLQRMWPVAAIFEQELNKCHSAVQGALAVW